MPSLPLPAEIAAVADARAAAVAPVVIVGAGPAGMRLARTLLERDPRREIVIYGDEPSTPYDRVRLSALLMGEIGWAGIAQDLKLPDGHRVVQHYHCAVLGIDRTARTVRDAHGRTQKYSHLVLATGSRPRLPRIPGIKLPGVFTFRDLRDTEQLRARCVRSRRAVVLGGGLLGLETARALQRHGVEVAVVEHSPRLMSSQLDAGGAEALYAEVIRLGIGVFLGHGVKEIVGTDSVQGVRLASGFDLGCDTVVVAAGIVPNVDLALEAGLSVGRSIRVDDTLRTADPHIYAVGECAEHREKIYGFVAPGLEQAAVAASNILGVEAKYQGTVAAAQLKVAGVPVFSVGRVGEEESPTDFQSVVYAPGKSTTYRKLVLRRGRLVGAIAVGPWEETGRAQEAITRGRRLWLWQRLRFRRDGRLWPEQEARNVALWPATAVVCNCAGVTRGALSQALASGCNSMESLTARTGAGRVCGSCRPLLGELVGTVSQTVTQPGRQSLAIGSALALLLAILLIAWGPLPYSETVQGGFKPEVLWSDGVWKQVSGYSLVGLSLLGLLLSARKRISRIKFGEFAWWRVAHVLFGAATLAILVVHSGFSLGNNLNFMLMLSFLKLSLMGALAGAVTAIESRPTRLTRHLRAWTSTTHILLLWPLPALLGYHILSVYYF
ncbi:MAG: FAD-dependent oxidoreductase [Sulfuricaulis sp.]